METFGSSAPLKAPQRHFGFEPDNVAEICKARDGQAMAQRTWRSGGRPLMCQGAELIARVGSRNLPSLAEANTQPHSGVAQSAGAAKDQTTADRVARVPQSAPQQPVGPLIQHIPGKTD